MLAHIAKRSKKNGEITRNMKARIFSHGTRDNGTNNMRNECTKTQFDVIQIPIFILHFRIGLADVKWSFLKSGNILHTLFVRPPKDLFILFATIREMSWNIIRLPNDITEALSHLKTLVETSMLTVRAPTNLHRLGSLEIKYYLRGYHHSITTK